MRLQGKVVLITGASDGIGRATALAWAGEGASLALAARRLDRLEELASAIRGMGRSALAVPCDVSDEADVARLARVVLGEFGRIDVLFNCAGIGSFAPVHEMSVEAWDRTLAVNLRGTFLCCRAFLPAMYERRRGAILNVASAERGYPNKSAYNASKVAIVAFTQALAEEARPYNISVNCVRFGVPVDTKLADDVNKDITDRTGWQEPDDVTDILTFLAGQEGTYITGGYINTYEWKRQMKGPLAFADLPFPSGRQ